MELNWSSVATLVLGFAGGTVLGHYVLRLLAAIEAGLRRKP